MNTQNVTCCIAGGGPAGMMLGFLLARAGVEVVVLEKYPDFLRDFRGDTVHPSTLEIMYELGLLDEFLKRPHQESRQISGFVGKEELVVADFSHLPTHCKFVGIMPQWHFLDFLATHAKKYPSFHLRMQTEAKSLIEENGRVTGLRATSPEGELEIRADLVIGADGRHSTVRRQSGLQVMDIGAPIDVLWMRLSRRQGDPENPQGHFDSGVVFVMLNRSDYWQCAYVIKKNGYDEVRRKGLEAFRRHVAEIAPFMQDRVNEIKSWDDVKLLSVTVDRLKKWHKPGLLCIGDAAHAMSPIGGVGINLAIQDAAAAANILAGPLRRGAVTEEILHKVQERREFPVRVIQRLQVFVQDRILSRVLGSTKPLVFPWQLALLRKFHFLTYIPARLIGVGIRPEHVRMGEEVG